MRTPNSITGCAGQEALLPPTETFTDSYEALWPGLVRLGHLLTGSRALGEESAQEAFLGLLRRGPGVENPAAYLRLSVVNHAVSTSQRAERERHYIAGLREDLQPPLELDTTWQVLVTLPARQRAVLVLRYYEDLPEDAIAEVLGCRPGTVKSLASRGLTLLKMELQA